MGIDDTVTTTPCSQIIRGSRKTLASVGAVEVPIESKKLRDLRPDFPVIDIPPGEVVSALACNQETLIVGTSSGDLRVWSQSKEDFGAYKVGLLAQMDLLSLFTFANKHL